jgi:hypothetical protein
MTANDDFKRRHAHRKWAAAAGAVAIHVALLLLTPVFSVDFGSASGPRMVLIVDEWTEPPCPSGCSSSHVRFGAELDTPRLANGSHLNYRIPKLYPPALWREREPSSGTFQIVIDRRGRVRHAIPLETFSTGGEDALRALVPHMRFVPLERQGEPIVVVARVEVSIEAPL